LEAVLLLHVLGNLEPAQPLNLPLRRARPDRVCAPADVVVAGPFAEDAHERCAQTRLGGPAPGEELTHVAIDVRHSELFGDLGQIAHPGDATRLLELVPPFGRGAATGVAVGRVVNDEVE